MKMGSYRVNLRRIVPAAMLSLIIPAGCGVADVFLPADPRPCPRLAILKETHQLTLYRDGSGRDLTDVEATVAVSSVDYRCQYDDPKLDVGLDIAILLQRGPAATAGSFSVPYFVVLTDADRNIIAKRVFSADIQLPSGAEAIETIEEIDQRIPLSDTRKGPDLDIYVGLHLTPDQLEEQRIRRSNR